MIGSDPLPIPDNSIVRKCVFIINLLIISTLSVFAQPAITQINPVSGPPGTVVTITGSNFSPVPAENTVYFGVAKATVTAATTTTLTVTAPLGANAQPVSVMLNAKTATSRQAFNLTYSRTGILNVHSFPYVQTLALSAARQVVSADFDLDGKADIAAINNSNNAYFYVMRNYTTPGAATPSLFLAASLNNITGVVGGMVTGDVDGDRWPDLVASYPASNSINIYRNAYWDETIKFTLTTLSLAVPPGEIVLSDLDGDGLPELVVGTSSNILVYHNISTQGTPAWEFTTGINTGGSPVNVAVADVDGDGFKDIMCGNTTSNTVSVVRNKGAFSFDAPLQFTVVNNPTHIAAGDLNGDANPDIVVSSSSAAAATVLRNTSVPGSISFSDRLDITGIDSAGIIKIGDLTGEGKPDLAIAGARGFVTLQNISSGSTIAFSPAIKFPQNNINAAGLEMQDLNLDGKLDLLASVGYLTFCRNDCGLPFMDSFAPATAGYGQQVKIKGIDLDSASAVTFGGVVADSFRVISKDSVIAWVKNGSSGDIKITTPAGVATLSGFTYNPKIVINSLSPMLGKTGDTIKIRGYSLKDVSSITIGGVAPASYIIHSATSISVVIGTGASGDIVIQNPYGSVTIPGFLFNGRPVIESFTPTSGSNGSMITINGREFMRTTAVTVGGIPVSSYSVRSNNVIVANLGDNASGTVSVTTDYGKDSLSGFNFTGVKVSAITSFSPMTADSGKVIVINGTNFVNVKAVYIGGDTAMSFTVISPTQVRAVVEKTWSGGILVRGDYGDAVVYGFTYSSAPAIEQLRPYYGTKGSQIRIVGANFRNNSTVTIGGVPAQSFTIESDTVINAIIGNVTIDPGIWTVTVSSPDGSGSYGLYSGPVVNNISTQTAQAGNSVIINGTNFNAASVYFGGVKADITAASASALTVKLPAGGNLNTFSVTSAKLIAYSPQQLLPVYVGKDTAFTTSSFTKTDYVSGPVPGGPVFADIDGDGLNDVLEVQNQVGSSAFSVFRNTSKNGAITLAGRTDIRMAGYPQTVRTADMDGDGKPDVLVLSTNGVFFFRNRSTAGTISFDAGIQVAASFNFYDITVADFDGDGKVDFAISSSYDNNVATFRNASGTSGVSFTRQATMAIPSANAKLVSGDFDGDGKADLAWTSNSPEAVYLWRNKSVPGEIRFASPTIYNTYDAATSITAADLNNDGKMDLIVGHDLSRVVSLLRNNSSSGKISFTDGVVVKMNDYVYETTVADINGDGKPDLAVASNKIGLVKNNTTSGGRFEFSPVVELPDLGYMHISSADMDGDGMPDLAALVTNSNSKLTIYGNTSNREGEAVIKSFTPATAYAGDTITITGSNFSNVIKVGFGDTAALSFQIVNDTLIKAVVGTGSNGNVFVANNVATSVLGGFRLYPQLTAVTPDSGRVNELITITGKGLGAGTITLGGTVANLVSFTSTSMLVRIGEGYSGKVKVTIGGLTDSLPGFHFIAPSPTITGFSPDTVKTLGQVTITGTYFADVKSVSLGGVSVDSFKVINPQTIIANVGQGASGQVVVTTATGNAASARRIVCLAPHPVIRSFSPESGSAGTIVNISGVGFNKQSDSNYVYFGAVKATVVAASTTTLQVQVPFGATYEPLSVTANGATGYASKPFALTFNGGNLTDSSFKVSGKFGTDIKPGKILAADVDGDKNTDLVVMNTGNNSINVLNNTSRGDSLTRGPLLKLTAETYDEFLQDLDGDGKKDLFMQTSSDWYAVAWLQNLSGVGNPAFSDYTMLSFPLVGINNMATGDLDGDGHTDFVLSLIGYNITSLGHYNGNNTRVSFERQNGIIPTYNTNKFLLGDIDGDGKPDLVTAYSGGGGRGFGVFRNASTIDLVSIAQGLDFYISDAGGGAVNTVKLADLDGDGKKDVILVNNNNWVNVFKNTSSPGAISFTELTRFPVSGTFTEMAVGDLNGDGKPDLAIPNPAAGKVSVLQNTSTTGTISFATYIDYSAGNNPQGIAMADMNNDGRLDLVVSNKDSNQVSILLNRISPVIRPVINSFTPDTAKSGDTVHLFGKHLSNATAVNFGNVRATSFTVLSDSTIEVIVGAGKSGTISVITPGGADSLGGFVFLETLKISGFTPVSVAKGDTVVINGKGFIGITEVSFGGVAATSYNVISDTKITAVVGSGASGLVAVTAISGMDTLPGFTYLEKPVVKSFAPTQGYRGAAIVIYGKNFLKATGVSFGDFPADYYLIDSDSVIRAVVGIGGSGAVKVTTANYSAEANGFTFWPAPIITGFSPATATTGEIVVITGQNFLNVTAVALGGVYVSKFTVPNPYTILATVETGASGSVVVTAFGGVAQRSGFTYTNPVPNVSGFTPASGTAGTKVTVTGKNLKYVTGVAIGNVAVDSFKLISDSLISFVVPAGSTAALKLQYAGGTVSFADFVYDKPVADTTPLIRSFYPSSGTTGEQINVIGKNFTHVSSVTLGAVQAAGFILHSDSAITVTIGSGATGAITVSGRDGVSSMSGFTFIPPVPVDKTPHIYSFNPVSGGTGTVVRVAGKNLADVSAVTLGAIPVAGFTIDADSAITLVVGNGASGALKVSGPKGADSLGGFVFIPSVPVTDSTPLISGFYPASAAAGTTVTINGKWFTDVTGVTFGGVPASSFSVVSDTKIEAVAGTGNTGSIAVKTAHGTAVVNGFTYLIPPVPVVIYSFSPVSGGSGTSLTIMGNGFTRVLHVSIGDTAVGSFVIVNDSTILAIAAGGGTGEVKVMTATDTAVLGTFTYIRAAESGMLVYPNPVASGATITTEFPVTDKDAELTIVDVNGNVIRTIKMAPGTGKVNITLSGLQAGIYRIVWRTAVDKMSRPLMIVD